MTRSCKFSRFKMKTNHSVCSAFVALTCIVFCSAGGRKHHWQGELFCTARIMMLSGPHSLYGVFGNFFLFGLFLQKGESVKKMREEVGSIFILETRVNKKPHARDSSDIDSSIV